jgi:hypothetical protein
LILATALAALTLMPGPAAWALKLTPLGEAALTLGLSDAAAKHCGLHSTELDQLRAEFEWLLTAPTITEQERSKIRARYEEGVRYVEDSLGIEGHGCAEQPGFQDYRLFTLRSLLHSTRVQD